MSRYVMALIFIFAKVILYRTAYQMRGVDLYLVVEKPRLFQLFAIKTLSSQLRTYKVTNHTQIS